VTKRISKERKERIKRFFLKPIVCTIIYYIVWMLPWNIMYWIYFYIMEHGWYWRVWINSVRDIILWKVFKWDSRIYFYELNERISKNRIVKLIYRIKDKIVKGILRSLLILSWIKKIFLEVKITQYIMSRIIILCYLSIFYLYMFKGIIIINYYVFYIVIIIEVILMLLFDNIITIIIKKKKEKYIIMLAKIVKEENFWLMYDPLDLRYYDPARAIFEENNMVWNKILGDSVSLNILYEYMLYVNKNTKGYYYYKYGILTKIKSIKLYELSNIPWSILPETRYTIMAMRYVQWNIGKNYKWEIEENMEKQIEEKLGIKIKRKKIKNIKIEEI